MSKAQQPPATATSFPFNPSSRPPMHKTMLFALKRIEWLAKDHPKALKADDEEAYMKLIDAAKDARITHLLRLTDTYLDPQKDGKIDYYTVTRSEDCAPTEIVGWCQLMIPLLYSSIYLQNIKLQ
ncbi:hypothetical protein F5887DRAFT_1079853 [Amanita rubescens]|nr:hypothetical protein F5887DRAFT_1079853 [Amanita rubescens]